MLNFIVKTKLMIYNLIINKNKNFKREYIYGRKNKQRKTR